METLTCFFCGKECHDWQALAWHLVENHKNDRVVNGERLAKNAKGTVTCWCGAYFAIGVYSSTFLTFSVQADIEGKWAKHLKRYGGVEAHIMEVALGTWKRKRKR